MVEITIPSIRPFGFTITPDITFNLDLRFMLIVFMLSIFFSLLSMANDDGFLPSSWYNTVYVMTFPFRIFTFIINLVSGLTQGAVNMASGNSSLPTIGSTEPYTITCHTGWLQSTIPVCQGVVQDTVILVRNINGVLSRVNYTSNTPTIGGFS